MDPSAQRRYRAVRALFERVADLPAAERDAILGEEPDPEARDEVRRLLAMDALDVELTVPGGPTPLPASIGPYRVVREVGRGAMGTVYEAEEAAPRRRVALKVVHPWYRTPQLAALTRQEAQAMADVRHPGIPAIYALVDVDGAPVVAMELVHGVPITRFCERLPWRARLAVLVATCDAVACAHAAGITHRDLKPANILVTAAGEPKVLDFGIAGHRDRPAPAGSGTLRYMAPEQRGKGDATPASDVYSLAVVCVEVLAAPAPVEEEPAGAPALHALRDDLRAVLLRALSADPSRRYPDASALAAELRRVADDRVVDAQATLFGARVRSALRRHPFVASGTLLLLGAFAAWAPIERAWGGMRAEARLRELVGGGAGYTDPSVRDAVDTLLADPRVLVSPVATEAFTWKAAQLADDARLDALAAAWVFSTGSAEAAARDALARALFERGEPGTAGALGPFTDPSLRELAAIARWDFGSADLGDPTARKLAALRTAVERPAGVRSGAILPEGWVALTADTLTWQPAEGEAWTVAMPWEAAAVVVSGDRYAVRGGPWVGTGTLGGAPPRTVEVSAGVADVLLPDGATGVDALYTLRHGASGLFGLVAGAPRTLDASASERRLSARTLLLRDLDGDGAPELAVTATGWQGNELRVLTGPLDDLRLLARLRMSAWGVTAVPEEPGLLYVVGGPLPSTPVGGGERRSLVPVRLVGGALVPGTPLPLTFEAFDVYAVDLDGDRRSELLVAGSDHVEIVDRDRPLSRVWLPDTRFVTFGRPPDARADQLWLRAGERTFVLGTGPSATPVRDPVPRAEPPPPAALAHGPFAAPWTRAAALAALGEADLAAAPLATIVAATGGLPAAMSAALSLLTEQGDRPSPRVVTLAEDALDVPETAGRARDLLRRAHAFDGPVAATVAPSLAGTSSLTFDRPLPPSVTVPGVGAVRRNAVRSRLELALRGDTGTALSIPLTSDGTALCADLALDLREIDWAAGLSVTLRQGVHASSVKLWRVGGGARTQHLLQLAAAPGARAASSSALTGPHTVSVCLTGSPGTMSSRLDEQPRIPTSTGWAPVPGRIDLVLGAPVDAGYAVDRMAWVDLVSVTLRGASFAEEEGEDPLPRRVAEGEIDALVALRSRSPWAGAIADEALDRVSPASLAGLSRGELRALLRRSTATWGAPVATATGAAYPSLWAEAWEIPLAYEDPPAWQAVVDPSLEAPAPATEPVQRVALLRARSLLEQGRVAAAESALATLRDHSADAWLVTARLELRRGDHEAARGALRTYLTRARSSDAAVDTVADDPELAPLLPDLPAAPTVR